MARLGSINAGEEEFAWPRGNTQAEVNMALGVCDRGASVAG